MTQRQWRARAQDFTTRVVQLKAEAGEIGLFETMHALEPAVQKVGWERARIEAERIKGWRPVPGAVQR